MTFACHVSPGIVSHLESDLTYLVWTRLPCEGRVSAHHVCGMERVRVIGREKAFIGRLSLQVKVTGFCSSSLLVALGLVILPFLGHLVNSLVTNIIEVK